MPISDISLKIKQYLRKGGKVAKTKYAVLLRIEWPIEWYKNLDVEFLTAEGCLDHGSIFSRIGP